jgi:hypothetical protein
LRIHEDVQIGETDSDNPNSALRSMGDRSDRSDGEGHRHKIVSEILSTEKAYLDSLTKIVDVRFLFLI